MIHLVDSNQQNSSSTLFFFMRNAFMSLLPVNGWLPPSPALPAWRLASSLSYFAQYPPNCRDVDDADDHDRDTNDGAMMSMMTSITILMMMMMVMMALVMLMLMMQEPSTGRA